MKRERVYADTNILLDWLGKREPHYVYAEALFILAENKEIEVLVSTVSIVTTHYILQRSIGIELARQAIMGIRTICKVCSSGSKEIDLALLSEMKDFDDAFQYFNAVNNSAGVIITRNAKDFKGSQIPVMSAEAYVKTKLSR